MDVIIVVVGKIKSVYMMTEVRSWCIIACLEEGRETVLEALMQRKLSMAGEEIS